MYLPVIEGPDESGDLHAVILQREMTRVEQVQLDIPYIPLEGTGTILSEDGVVSSPQDQSWWLAQAQIFMPAWILFHVFPVVVKQIELNTVIPGSGQEKQVHVPSVRADPFRVACTFAVDPLYSLGSEESGQWCLRFRSTTLPQGRSQCVPDTSETFFIGIVTPVEFSVDLAVMLGRLLPLIPNR